jgi:hypothetical protein
MLRLAIAIAAIAALLAGDDALAKRKRNGRQGKAVRVERASASVRRQPRILQVASQTQVTSYGFAPEEGASFTIVDPMGVVARATVVAARPRVGQCQEEMYDVEFQADSWARTFNYTMFGVTGIDVAPEGKLIQQQFAAPSATTGESVWAGFDTTGDGVANMLITYYPCGDTEPAAANMMPYCMDAYTRESESAEWERATHDVYYQCR